MVVILTFLAVGFTRGHSEIVVLTHLAKVLTEIYIPLVAVLANSYQGLSSYLRNTRYDCGTHSLKAQMYFLEYHSTTHIFFIVMMITGMGGGEGLGARL